MRREKIKGGKEKEEKAFQFRDFSELEAHRFKPILFSAFLSSVFILVPRWTPEP